MPPTLAAASTTTSGRSSFIHPATAAWSLRSSAEREIASVSQSSDCSLRTIAEPTMPRCPATKTRLPAKVNGVESDRVAIIVLSGHGAISLAVAISMSAATISATSSSECGRVRPAEPYSRLRRVAQSGGRPPSAGNTARSILTRISFEAASRPTSSTPSPSQRIVRPT